MVRSGSASSTADKARNVVDFPESFAPHNAVTGPRFSCCRPSKRGWSNRTLCSRTDEPYVATRGRGRCPAEPCCSCCGISYVVRQPGEARVDKDAAAAEKRKAAGAASGQSLKTGPGADLAVGVQDLANQPTPGAPDTKVLKTNVAGIGRPSTVDFEEHEYAWKRAGRQEVMATG